MTVPGVSLMTAATFIAAVGDIRRFHEPRQAGRLPRPGPQGPPVGDRRRASRADLQAGRLPGAPDARRGRVRRRQHARTDARVLRARPRAPRQPDRDRRRRAQARRAVLAPAHPRAGLRLPAPVADPQEAPRPRTARRRPAAPRKPRPWRPRTPTASAPTANASASSPNKPKPPTAGSSPTGRQPHRQGAPPRLDFHPCKSSGATAPRSRPGGRPQGRRWAKSPTESHASAATYRRGAFPQQPPCNEICFRAGALRSTWRSCSVGARGP